MRLLWFNLATDLDDPVLGFTSGWIRAVAERVAFIHVITMRAGRVELPDNVRVHSLGKENGYGRVHRVARFYGRLLSILRSDRIDACFSHMIPAFTVLSAPVLMPRRIPNVTWYAHPSLTTTLKLAHHLSDRVVTSLPSAYPYRRDKLTVIGQGIDTRLFAPAETESDRPAMILCAGRLSPVKDHPVLLRAVALLRDRLVRPFRVVILGGPARASDASYVTSLRGMVRDLQLENLVQFHAGVPIGEVPRWYQRSTLHVNMTPAGFGDKVALEAMACGRPAVVANEDFRETLGGYADTLLFRHGDAEDLSTRLLWVLTLPREERSKLGSFLHDQVEHLHSLPALAEGIVSLLGRLSVQRRSR